MYKLNRGARIASIGIGEKAWERGIKTCRGTMVLGKETLIMEMRNAKWKLLAHFF